MAERISLEPEAVAVCDANAAPPFLFQLPPWRGRELLEEAQSTPVCMCPANIRRTVMNTGKWGRIPVYIVVPEELSCIHRMIFYIHGAGWVFGSFHTHEKLVRELATAMKFSYDPSALTVAGDSVGGSMAIVMVFMTRQWKDSCIQSLLLYYPVTNACRAAMDVSVDWICRTGCER